MVKLFMFSPVSGLYSCPLAMTDGAAKTIQVGNLECYLTSKQLKTFISVTPTSFIRGLQ